LEANISNSDLKFLATLHSGSGNPAQLFRELSREYLKIAVLN